MDKIKYRIILDAHKGGVQKVIRGFFTGDVASRTIAVNINVSGLPCNLGVGTAAIMYVTKSNGVTNYGACEVIDNTVYYDVNQSDIDSPGIVEMQLKILNGESVLYAPLFALDVQESKVSDTPAETTPTFSALEVALSKAQIVYDTRIVSIEITPEYVFVVKYADGSEYSNDCLALLFEEANYAIENVNKTMNSFEESKAELNGYVEDALEAKSSASASAENAAGSASESQTFANTASEFASRAEDAAERAEAVADLTIDTVLSTESTNPVANKAVAVAIKNVDATKLGGKSPNYYAPISVVEKLHSYGTNTWRQSGWYRIAEYSASDNVSTLKGAKGNGCLLAIKGEYQTNKNSDYLIKFSSAYNNQRFDLISAVTYGNTNVITKIRYTYNEAELKAYIEVYYSVDKVNAIYTEILAIADRGCLWKGVTPYATEETVEGVTVVTTLDIPANAIPATNLDLKPIVDGTSQVGNAKTLDGHGADDFAPSDHGHTADEVGALSKNGGEVSGNTTFKVSGYMGFKVVNTTSESSAFIACYNKNEELLGRLGFNLTETPEFCANDGTHYPLLHTGNSAKTVVVDTDPGEGATVSYSPGTIVFTK